MIANMVYASIKKNGKYLTKQQIKTLKGQVKAGDAVGAMRGLERLLRGGRV